MSSNRPRRFLRSVTFRLTLTYSAVFVVSALALLAGIYFLLRSSLRTQTDSMLQAEVQEVATQWHDEGQAAVQMDFETEARLGPGDEVYSRIVFADGRPTISTNPGFWRTLTVSADAFTQMPEEGLRYSMLLPDGQSDPVRLCSVNLGEGILLQVGHSMRNDLKVLQRYRQIAGGMLIAAFLPASLIGWLIARRAMSGVVRVAETAQQIENGDLTQRVQVSGEGDEIDLLAGSFNTMVERILLLLSEWKEISNNIAHDLRSPITRIRGLSETMAASSSDTETVEWAGSVIEECDRLIGIINTMLEIAETEAGTRPPELEPIDMAHLVADACDLFRPMAEDKKLELTFERPDTPVLVMAEPARLQRVVANLIDNAVKYTPNGGRIHLSFRRTDGQVELDVADTGIGLSEEDCRRIFDRFYRADPSRSSPGNGLGLSLVHAIAQAYGGAVSVTSTPRQGSTFTLRLPVVGKD